MKFVASTIVLAAAASACTREDIRAAMMSDKCASFKTIETPCAGDRPSPEEINADCCVTCKPAGIHPRPEDGSTGEKPEGCTRESVWANKDLCPKPAACGEAERPSVDDSCCLSCYFPKPACDRAACEASMEDLPVCTGGHDAADRYNPKTCCPKCKKPGKRPERGAKDDDEERKKRCGHDAFKTCMADAPDCADGEKPVYDGTCCLSCKRAGHAAKLDKIAKCGKLPECGDNESPARVESADGEFQCPTCKPPKPECNGGCQDRQVCVNDKSGEGTKCVSKKSKHFRMVARDALKTALSSEATEEEVRAVLVELVNRYCDKAENLDECTAHATTLIEGMVVRIKSKKTEGEEEVIETEVDVPEASTSRRLLSASGSPSDLLGNAVADNDDADLDVTGDESSATQVTTGMVAAVAVLATLAM